MNPKDRKFYEKWDRTRSRGIGWYIAPRAVVGGVILAILKLVLDTLLFWMATSGSLTEDEVQSAMASYVTSGAWINALISFVAFGLILAFVSAKLWSRNEKRYTELMRSTPREELPRNYTAAAPRGSKEKFPDYDWERKTK